MTDTADLNLVLAIILPEDRLKARAEADLAKNPGLIVPLSVGIELLAVGHKHGLRPVQSIGAAAGRFRVEKKDLLIAAAQALETGEVRGVFDAVHAADALHRGARLHTADREILASAFPATPF